MPSLIQQLTVFFKIQIRFFLLEFACAWPSFVDVKDLAFIDSMNWVSF